MTSAFLLIYSHKLLESSLAAPLHHSHHFHLSSLNLQVGHKLAEMKTEVCVGRAFVDQCIDLHAQHKLDSAMASMAKYWCTDLQSSVADRGVQLHGGWGYMWEYPVCKAFVDARVQSIYGGANEVMKELIARSITNPRK
jgi:long-chain-acyl-CoA dehydrogenase